MSDEQIGKNNRQRKIMNIKWETFLRYTAYGIRKAGTGTANGTDDVEVTVSVMYSTLEGIRKC